MSLEEDKKYERIGRTIVWLGYIRYAFGIFAVSSLIALAVLWLLRRPLWWSPVIGAGVTCVIMAVRRLFYRVFMRFLAWCNAK